VVCTISVDRFWGVFKDGRRGRGEGRGGRSVRRARADFWVHSLVDPEKGKSEIQGSLRCGGKCAASGRDDVRLWGGVRSSGGAQMACA
jgi:hypothetical protein